MFVYTAFEEEPPRDEFSRRWLAAVDRYVEERERQGKEVQHRRWKKMDAANRARKAQEGASHDSTYFLIESYAP